MRQTGIFYINDEKLELPLFQDGDRVYISKHGSTSSERVEGTVLSTREGGLFIDVKWDKDEYPSIFGGTVQIGKGRMVDGIRLVEEEIK